MAERKVPERLCIACRLMKPKKELIRIVKSDEAISLDFSGKKNGRGAYICPNDACINLCIKKRSINKAFKCNISDEVYSSLQKEFENYKGNS